MSSLSMNTVKSDIERFNRLNDSFKAIENAPPLLIGILPLIITYSLPSPVSACIAGAVYKYHLNVAKDESSIFNKIKKTIIRRAIGKNNMRDLIQAVEKKYLSTLSPLERSEYLGKKLENFGICLARKLYPYILAGAALKVLSKPNIKTTALAFICGMGAIKALEQRQD